MGKKARKTRWRTLEITDEQSDSEESHLATTPRLPKSFQQKSYYNKLPYSSQSTPRRKYQYDSTKSTRSSSTASENKITFNEEEYTRITTPRQDVLFKKGYLNKPKSYQTQTSTGTSTTSTGNSTGNGTPDHQSTDLEYDSQFVFPNGFVDQNGIYYVNSFESYPLMLYNPPTYYSEFTNSKSKRYSTGSLTESISPNNEEATSQDLSGCEASNNVSDYSSHHSVYNMVYPGYYVNGVCPPQEMEVGQCPTDQTRKLKKRKRRKTSRSQTTNQDESTECSEDEDLEPIESVAIESEKSTCSPVPNQIDCTETKTNNENLEEANVVVSDRTIPVSKENEGSTEPLKPQKYDLKPDAEEFVPRAYRTPEIPLSPVQFIKVPPNFVPIPVVPFNGQINPAFIPPGSIPINFIPPDPKLFPPNFTNFVPSHPKKEVLQIKDTTSNDQNSKVCDTNSNTAKVELPTKIDKPLEKTITNSKAIDIATVVSKLQEAVKEQEENNEDKTKIPDPEQSPKKNQIRTNQRFRNNYKRNFYNSPRNSPQRQDGDDAIAEPNVQAETRFLRKSPDKFRKNWKNPNTKWQPNGVHTSPKIQTSAESNQVMKPHSNTLEKPKSVSVSSSPKVVPPVNKLPHQWIPVSSRKKRKNKNVEESDFPSEETAPIEDEFESYDVDLLEDVIPQIEEEIVKVEMTEEKVEDIISNIAQTESNIISNLPLDIPSVTDIENELIAKSTEIKKETEIIENDLEENKPSKKKSKKGTQKVVTKRVIITDIDMSDKCEEVKTPTKKVVKKVDKPKEVPEIKTEAIEEPVAKVVEEKKAKKKKKKATKGDDNITEDAYNLLLDTSLATEVDKTNDEISVELDKMIQKGIYSNLEEKMRSLNLSETDGFFKSVFSKVPVAGRSEPAGYLKSPDFTKIPLLKPDSVSEEQNLDNKKTNDELPASESSEISLEKADLDLNQPEEPKGLYPITEAVKEWMCKTRETTPDVEIFKSPSTIYKEFCGSDSNSDTEVCCSRNLSDELSASGEEDEITLFTTEDADKTGEGSNEDLLEYWEDLQNEEKIKTSEEVVKKEYEEGVEVYESKYGNNEDFLKLQEEAREKAKSMNYPRHGNLPYRAICCNVM